MMVRNNSWLWGCNFLVWEKTCRFCRAATYPPVLPWCPAGGCRHWDLPLPPHPPVHILVGITAVGRMLHSYCDIGKILLEPFCWAGVSATRLSCGTFPRINPIWSINRYFDPQFTAKILHTWATFAAWIILNCLRCRYPGDRPGKLAKSISNCGKK